jgi:hypothetical protein
MAPRKLKIGREGVGAYWFVNTAAAKDLHAARARMREIASVGFTEVWIAARYIEDPESPGDPLLGPLYRRFLEEVAEEADHLGILLVPFIVPCGFGEMSPPKYELRIFSCGEVRNGGARLDLGKCPVWWDGGLSPLAAFAWRTLETDLSASTVDSRTVRPVQVDTLRVEFSRGTDDVIAAAVSGPALRDGEELCVMYGAKPGTVVPGISQCAPDVTAPGMASLMTQIVESHETLLRRRPCYAGLAFDEPNIADTSNDPVAKAERERRFYWSEPLVAEVKRRSGIDLQAAPWLLARPDDSTGHAARMAYFGTIQECLVEAFATAMRSASVPLLGTHDWSGDRDRALYNTFDQVDFARVREFAATDISGLQSDDDYSASEPLIAFCQKDARGKPRAMMMTDHFSEPVDGDYLLHTCERHAALGIDYMLLHAYGQITGDPPLWTSIESWIASRETRALEAWCARMKALSALNRYRGTGNILVVFPRLGRVVRCGDRYVTREWDRVLFAMHSAHFAPVTMSQRDFAAVTFSGGRARWQGRRFGTIVFPCFAGLDPAEMNALRQFHQEGGNVVFTKPDYAFCTGDGRPSPEVRAIFEEMLGIAEPPGQRRFREGETIQFRGRTHATHRLRDGASLRDDWCLDFGGSQVVESRSRRGGTALLAGFETAALSCGEDYHRLHTRDMIAFWDAVLAPLAPRPFTCEDAAGAQDYGVLGLVRKWKGETLLTLHRRHGRQAAVRAGRVTVHIPPDPAGRRVPGCSVFVHHAEEFAHVVCNPFGSILRELDLGRDIARVASADGLRWCALFDGPRLRLALPAGREMRFACIEYGTRDAALPAELRAETGDILEAWVPKASPGTLVMRAIGPGRAAVSVSLDPGHGASIAAKCVTSAMPGTVKAENRGGRIHVLAEFTLVDNIENDLAIVQS